jgi:hypothetical protein
MTEASSQRQASDWGAWRRITIVGNSSQQKGINSKKKKKKKALKIIPKVQFLFSLNHCLICY